jgi:pimeloyl-ACP methyl ester carboxylesterase
MDVLRRALRESQISYVGLSFGTELGAVYASLFPKRVRAMVLDGGIRPDFRDGLVEFASEQTISFELTLHRLDLLCRQDAACRLHDSGVVAALDTILAQLAAAPVTAPDGTVLTARHVRSIVASLLSVESAWPLIVRAVADAQSGDYALFFQLIPAISTVPLSNTAFFAIKCNDFGTRRSAAEYLPVSEAVGAVTPRLHDRLQVASVVSTCAAWPEADVPSIRPVQQRLANPLLIVGNDFDPNTPLSWTRSLAAALGVEHGIVRYQGGGHTIVTRATPCIGGIVSAYLFNLVVPEEGTACPARPISFAPQLPSNALQVLGSSWDTPWQQVESLPVQ